LQVVVAQEAEEAAAILHRYRPERPHQEYCRLVCHRGGGCRLGCAA
jgi:hypothetical protein